MKKIYIYPMWEFGHVIVEVGFIEKLKRLTSLINVVSWKGTLIKISSYNVPFVCNFVLENYPFDNQKCQVIIANLFLFLMCIISANVLSLTSYIRSRSVTPFDRMLSLQHGLHFPLWNMFSLLIKGNANLRIVSVVNVHMSNFNIM